MLVPPQQYQEPSDRCIECVARALSFGDRTAVADLGLMLDEDFVRIDPEGHRHTRDETLDEFMAMAGRLPGLQLLTREFRIAAAEGNLWITDVVLETSSTDWPITVVVSGVWRGDKLLRTQETSIR